MAFSHPLNSATSASGRSPDATRERVLFGASGQLGGAVRSRLSGVMRTVDWRSVDWDALRDLPPSDFIFANGLIDPRLPAAELREANLEFPRRIIEASRGLAAESRHRFLTLGSIQENFPEVCRANPYLASKLELSEWMQGCHVRPGGEGRFLHLRIHTVYGSMPKPHMFLGQIAQAIREKRTFAMSSGDQLREYHHRDDIAQAIVNVLARDWDFGPTLELNSGAPVRLADLARAIFRAYGAESLLQIGAIPRHQAENTSRHFEASPEWLLPRRDPIAGVIDSLKQAVV